MGFVLTAEWEKGTRGAVGRDGESNPMPDGVTLAQLNEVTERATQECISRGIDPATITPKTLNRLGGKIKKISIEV